MGIFLSKTAFIFGYDEDHIIEQVLATQCKLLPLDAVVKLHRYAMTDNLVHVARTRSRAYLLFEIVVRAFSTNIDGVSSLLSGAGFNDKVLSLIHI